MENKIYSNEIANAINDFLSDGWNYDFNEKKGIFRFDLNIRGKIKEICYSIYVYSEFFTTYATSPIGADEDDEAMMSKMSEFINRANFGLKRGNFEFDLENGEIRFKYFNDCKGIVPTAEMIGNSIYCIAAVFEQYSEGIVNIIFTDMNAKDAVELCEKSVEDKIGFLLSQLADSGEDDDDEFISKLAEFEEDLDVSDEDEDFIEAFENITHIKTDLFNAEGENI